MQRSRPTISGRRIFRFLIHRHPTWSLHLLTIQRSPRFLIGFGATKGVFNQEDGARHTRDSLTPLIVSGGMAQKIE
jgi:hypothetical protein